MKKALIIGGFWIGCCALGVYLALRESKEQEFIDEEFEKFCRDILGTEKEKEYIDVTFCDKVYFEGA